MDDPLSPGSEMAPDEGLAKFPVTRESLYRQVWAEPMLKVAERYNVSSSFMARVCSQMNVPRPERGYWAKLAAGSVEPKPSLPAARPGDLVEWGRGVIPKQHLVVPRETKPDSRRRKAGIPDQPSVHPLIRGAADLFVVGRENNVGFLKPHKKLLPDLVVTKGTLDRALTLANQFFKALEHRGYSVILAPSGNSYVPRAAFDEREKGGSKRNYVDLWAPMRPTLIYIKNVVVGVTIFEMTEEVEVKYQNGKYVRVTELPLPAKHSKYQVPSGWTSKRDLPSGRLAVQLYSPFSRTEWKPVWRERHAGEIEEKVSSIVRHLEREEGNIANLLEETRKQEELERIKREQEWERYRREEEERQRQKAIKDSRDALLSVIQAWDEQRGIDAFFREVRVAADALGDETKLKILNRLDGLCCTNRVYRLLGDRFVTNEPEDAEAASEAVPHEELEDV